MEFSPVEIVNLINNRSPYGSYTIFVKLNDSIGVKLTRDIAVRDGNFLRQQEAAKYGLGPEVYGKIDDIYYRGDTYYGYFTEVVEVADWNSFYNENEDSLCQELEEKIAFDFYDCKPNNCGIKNGKLICIDFDSIDYNFEFPSKTRFYGF